MPRIRRRAHVDAADPRRVSTRRSIDLVVEKSMDPKLLEMLVCPVTKGPLIHDRERRSSSRSRRGSRIRSATAFR